MAMHTPGPWSVLNVSTREEHRWVVYREGLEPVCKSIRTAADARLIAAAPDLLAACEAFMGTVDKSESVLAIKAIGVAITKARDEAE